ncbi:hypothetical protein [Clostridium sp. CF012]|uniref:hypothetical protein n=1 Tax=Clostridium sp. CF012 TaxID=2843319 RepID=UPI001C0ADAF1|nr:hypothetical protein [Clostridium sp. CF012]MBU3144600.1 hypothetical protein [Clostridium sp. CF012]
MEEKVYETITSFLKLTNGARFDFSSLIIETQKLTMMKFYLRNEENCVFDYRKALSENLPTEIDNHNPITINIVENPSNDRLEEKKKKKTMLNNQFQCLKDTYYKGKNFDEQLEDEYLGTYTAIKSNIIKLGTLMQGKGINSFDDMELFTQCFNPIKKWIEFGGSSSSKDYLDYLKSEEFRMIPYIHISTLLTTDIFTSKKLILPTGDIKDIENISTLLPYCDFILIDDEQRRRITRLLGEYNIYNTKCFSIKTIDGLISKIEKI